MNNNSNIEHNENSHTNRETELDEAAELIQSVGFAYLDKKHQLNEKKELSILKNKIHNIVFENREKLPEGIYIELMNALK